MGSKIKVRQQILANLIDNNVFRCLEGDRVMIWLYFFVKTSKDYHPVLSYHIRYLLIFLYSW